ncbi:nitrite reductase large subunit [Salmonella enterica subsp. arizonae]|nr:nitrite reductase large subunit [Salmonella enterica subsp. arizonae]
MSKVRLAIIGNGMVGHRFIEDLLDKSDASLFDITVFCEEPRKAYDRVHLSSYFSHHTRKSFLWCVKVFTEARREGAGWRTRDYH